MLLNQRLSFKAYKTYLTAIVLKLYKNKNLRCSFKAPADAADKGELYSICSTPEISERSFCDGLEMKFPSPSCGIQQTGAPETTAKSSYSLFLLAVSNSLFLLAVSNHKRFDTTLYSISLSPTSTRS